MTDVVFITYNLHYPNATHLFFFGKFREKYVGNE